MFYDKYVNLCRTNKVTPSKAAIDCGFNKGSVSVWKKKYENGEDIKPTSDILIKIADYFGVTVDYLLGNEQKENPAADSDEALRFALYGSDSQDITKEMLDEIREIAAIKREMNRRKNGTK